MNDDVLIHFPNQPPPSSLASQSRLPKHLQNQNSLTNQSDRKHTDSRPRPPLILHGRQMPRLLHHHDRLLARTDRRRLWWVQHRAVSAYRWESAVDGGMLV